MLIPISLRFVDDLGKHGVQRSVEPFHDSVGRRLVGCGSQFMDLEPLHEFTEQIALELRAAVR